MESRSLATIYALSDPRTKSKIRYVGCTTLPLEKRLCKHLSSRHNQRKMAWIDLLRADNLAPLIWELEISEVSSSKSKEDWWIRTIQNHGRERLFNVACLGNMKRVKYLRNRPIKLNEGIVKSIRSEFGFGVSISEISVKYGVSSKTASEIVKRRSWRQVK